MKRERGKAEKWHADPNTQKKCVTSLFSSGLESQGLAGQKPLDLALN